MDGANKVSGQTSFRLAILFRGDGEKDLFDGQIDDASLFGSSSSQGLASSAARMRDTRRPVESICSVRLRVISFLH